MTKRPASNEPAPSAAAAPCRHCGTFVEGAEYCCAGCELAAAILSDAGLERWYASRAEYAPRPDQAELSWKAVPVESAADGTAIARLAVDGLRCASCVWVVERLLEATPGVSEAHVSYATGRARVRWDPEQTDLAAVAGRIAAIGYRPRPATEQAPADRDLLMRLGVAAFCTANLMTLTAAVYVGWWQGMDEVWTGFFHWLTLLLATPVALWSARPFLDGALRGLAAGALHMDVPISLAVGILYGHGVVATLDGRDGYLDSLAMLVTLLLVGRVLEARGRKRVQEAVSSLAAELPVWARRVVEGGVEDVDPSELAVGDLVEVPAGSEIPADGVVVEGRSAVRMALLTGESEPRPVGPGDSVVAGGVVELAAVRVRVEATGGHTLLGRMAGALEERLGADERRDPVAPWFTAATLAAAALTWSGWTLAGSAGALEATVAVLVVACPCALALAHPLTAASGLAAAARRGLLLRSGDALVDLGAVELVALDKTGTLTRGTPEVVEASDADLRIAAGLERSSAHPVARAVIREAAKRGIALPLGTDVVETPGSGIRGVVDGVAYALRSGGPGVLALHGPDRVGRLLLRDVPRDDASDTVAALRAQGLDVAILTGDRAEVAERVAAEVGAPVLAELDPLAKAAWIEAQARPTLFVGDGLNDGPALAAAGVGVAMGTGAAASVWAADGVISDEGVGPVVAGLQIARATRQAIRRSRRRAVVYNVVAVGAAMAGLVNPLVAAVAMPISSLLVIWEAARLGRRG